VALASVGEARAKRFYTVAEVAALLGLSDPTVYRAIRAGEFPAIRVRGRYVIPAKAIDQLESSALAAGLVDSAGQVPGGVA
jgi:excisionase family DNA binding protein